MFLKGTFKVEHFKYGEVVSSTFHDEHLKIAFSPNQIIIKNRKDTPSELIEMLFVLQQIDMNQDSVTEFRITHYHTFSVNFVGVYVIVSVQDGQGVILKKVGIKPWRTNKEFEH